MQNDSRIIESAKAIAICLKLTRDELKSFEKNLTNIIAEKTVSFNDETKEALLNEFTQQILTTIHQEGAPVTEEARQEFLDGSMNVILDTIQKYGDRISLLEETVGKKSDIDHIHNYSPVDHEHVDLASHHDLKQIEGLAKEVDRKNDRTNNMLRQVLDELTKKLDSDQALTKKDVDRIVTVIQAQVEKGIVLPDFNKMEQEIINTVAASIPTPKDGREWEFKFHPQKQGVLMYKRSDETQWRVQSLLVKETVFDRSVQSGGGGGGNTGTKPVINIYTQDSTGDNIFRKRDRLKQLIFTTVTDGDGNFSLDYSVLELGELVDLEVESSVIVGNEPLINRLTEAYVDTADLTNLTGTVFVTRNSRMLIGTASKTIVPAPAGTVVKIRVLGA